MDAGDVERPQQGDREGRVRDRRGPRARVRADGAHRETTDLAEQGEDPLSGGPLSLPGKKDGVEKKKHWRRRDDANQFRSWVGDDARLIDAKLKFAYKGEEDATKRPKSAFMTVLAEMEKELDTEFKTDVFVTDDEEEDVVGVTPMMVY